MANADATSRLNPEALDDVVSELSLEEARAIDRLTNWVDDLRDSLWDWLKGVTGGEDGWLNRLNQWFRDLLPDLGGAEVPDATPLLTGLSWLSVLALVGGILYAIYLIWKIYRPPAKPSNNVVYQRLQAEAALPIHTLVRSRQPAALFAQVCLRLVSGGNLSVYPDSTNETLARTAKVSDGTRQGLLKLAKAADRGLFSAWEPSADELSELTQLHGQMLSSAESDRQPLVQQTTSSSAQGAS